LAAREAELEEVVEQEKTHQATPAGPAPAARASDDVAPPHWQVEAASGGDQKFIKIACPGAREEDVDVTSYPDCILVSIDGIFGRTSSFEQEFPLNHRTEGGIFELRYDECYIDMGVLHLILRRALPQRMRLRGAGLVASRPAAAASVPLASAATAPIQSFVGPHPESPEAPAEAGASVPEHAADVSAGGPSTPPGSVLRSSSLPTISSRPTCMKPGQDVALSALAGLLQDGRLPSLGTISHPLHCEPCAKFLRGVCARGHDCSRCHGPHDGAEAPQGGGRQRQRDAVRRGSLRRVRTPDSFE